MKRILLIAPEWLPADEVAGHWESLRRENPEARFVLLASAPAVEALADQIEEALAAPAWRDFGAVAATLRQLWRFRFERAIVLFKPHRFEFGYWDAKMWAFAVRAVRREMLGLRELNFLEELADKWRITLPLMLGRRIISLSGPSMKMLSLVAPRLVRKRSEPWPPQARQQRERLETFVYLNAFSRRALGRQLEVGGLTGLVLLCAREAQQTAQIVRGLGGTVRLLALTNPRAASDGAQPEADFALVLRAVPGPDGRPLAARTLLCALATEVKPRGLSLVRLSSEAVPGEELSVLPPDLARECGWSALETSESLLAPNSLDVWLQRDGVEPERGEEGKA